MMTPRSFVDALADLTLANTFNPYLQRCPIHDRADAPARRRANLRRFIEASLAARVDTFWIARDLGYRGGRRTGVPLTDEVHLAEISQLFCNTPFCRATRGPIVAERTAAIVWQVIRNLQVPIFLWNVFPLHPHEPSDPLSNRCHTRSEREATKHLLKALIDMMEPKKIIAIGRDAQLALSEFGISTMSVRHPSYGGQAEFIEGLHSIYGVCPMAHAA